MSRKAAHTTPSGSGPYTMENPSGSTNKSGSYLRSRTAGLDDNRTGKTSGSEIWRDCFIFGEIDQSKEYHRTGKRYLVMGLALMFGSPTSLSFICLSPPPPLLSVYASIYLTVPLPPLSMCVPKKGQFLKHFLLFAYSIASCSKFRPELKGDNYLITDRTICRLNKSLTIAVPTMFYLFLVASSLPVELGWPI